MSAAYFRINLSRGEGLISLSEGFSTFNSSYFERNTPVGHGVLLSIAAVRGVVYAIRNAIIEILNCLFKQNKAQISGGALYVTGKKLVVKSSVFEDNAAVPKLFNHRTFGGAIFAVTESIIDVQNCSFKRNVATNSGGAIFASGKKLLIKSSVFNNNTVMYKYFVIGYGGAVYAGKSSFTTETVNSCYGSRGCYFCPWQGIIIIELSSFQYNTAFGTLQHGKDNCVLCRTGGAIYSYTAIKISGSLFIGNRAQSAGGAIYQIHEDLHVKTSTFKNNTAYGLSEGHGAGGAIYSSAATNISGSLFIGNRAQRFGGAIYHTKEDLHVKPSTFKNNTTYYLSEEGAGGAIFTRGNRKIIIKSSCFEHNEAFGNKLEYGGAISLDERLFDTDIGEKYSTGNKAEVNGRPIFHHKGELRIEASMFKHNTAFGYPQLAVEQ